MYAPRLFRTKSLNQMVGETLEPQLHLKRVLGPVHLTLLGVGAIVGAGIFSTVGTAAAGGADRAGAGPALVLSFVLVAVACGFAAVSTVAEETRNPQRNLPIGIIASLIVCTILYVAVAFVLVAAGVVVLRRTDPGRTRPFRTPFVPWVPLLAILTCGYLMLEQPRVTWARFVIWLAIGLVLYFAYGYCRSRLNPDRITGS